MQAGDGTGTRGHAIPKHVWVAVDGRWHEPKPGLLYEWRRGPHGFEARVTWASGGGNVAVSSTEKWVPADAVREAKAPPPQS